MRWQGRRGSENVEDRRSMGGPAMIGVGGGGLGLVVIVVCLCLGINPLPLLQQQQGQVGPQGGGGAVQPGQIDQVDPQQDELAKFASVVLRDTEDVWTQLFQQAGLEYRDPKLVLFRDRVNSACGFASAATGPFYCPSDEKVYIDLGFFDDMDRQLGAPGDFARAYVIAHEVGHHVQKLLGTADKVAAEQRRAGDAKSHELSVRLELQADYFAGVWANHAQQNWQILEPGDVEEALNAATAIGDDRLQKQAQGYIVPETFTHGTSAQRVKWFSRGLKSGKLNGGDTFGIPYSDL